MRETQDFPNDRGLGRSVWRVPVMGTRKGRGAQGTPPKRPGRSRPSLPDEVGGLVAALRQSRGKDDGTVRRWVEEKQPLLEDALRAWGRTPDDAHRLAERLLVEAFLATAKEAVIEREIPWMAGTIANLWHETRRTRRKEKEKAVPLDEVPSSSPTPFEVFAEADESNHQKEKVLEAARIFPPPYGHVLFWRLILGLTWQEIQARLNSHRPPGSRPIKGRRARKISEEALTMFGDYLAGVDPRSSYPQRYLAKKNPWIGATLPPLTTQT